VARPAPNTTIIVAVAAAVAVVAASAAVIVVTLQDRGQTTAIETTTVPPTITTTTGEVSPGATVTTVPADVDESRVAMPFGGHSRSYLVVAPRRVAAQERLPVVMVLHGLGVNSDAMSRAADWRGAVERHRFLAVFPQGLADSWNMGPCCPPANLAQIDDIGFLSAVVDEVAGRPDVDLDRRYLTGFSNGGIMTYAFGCARSDAFAAMAPMAGSNISDCFPEEPLPMLHQHADPDPVVPFDGSPTFGQLLSAADFPDVPSSVGRWAERSGCVAGPTSRIDGDGVEYFSWQGCPDGAEVQLIRIPGPGHTWPRLGGYDPLETLLDFFGIS
jgi:polyhydroxybutyrate depolymerase